MFDCDVQVLRGLIAEDYLGYDPAGNPQDLKMTLEAYQRGGVQLDRYDVEDLEVRIVGELGTITGKGYISVKSEFMSAIHKPGLIESADLEPNRNQLTLNQ